MSSSGWAPPAFGAVTSGGGRFSIDVGSADAKLSDFFQVDTSGAGATFSHADLITYSNGQTYYPDEVDMPVDILNAVTNDFGVIMVRENQGSGLSPRLLRCRSRIRSSLVASWQATTNAGIPNVQVIFGFTPAKTQ